LLHKEYDVGPRLLSLEKFRPLLGIHRYLIVELASPRYHSDAGALVARNLGISAQAWSALPLFPLPRSTYQAAVRAYLVEPPSDWVPPARTGGGHRKGARP